MQQNEPQLANLLTSTSPPSQSHIQQNKALPLQMCQQGRSLLMDKKYLQASKCFSKSVIAFEYLIKNGHIDKEETVALWRQVMIPVYSNLCLCHLQMGMYESVVIFANQILGHNGGHAKARYRRGLAYQKLNKFQEAIQDFQLVKKLEAGDEGIVRECERLVRECKDGIKRQKEKARKIAGKMVSQIGDQRSQRKIQQQIQKKKSQTKEAENINKQQQKAQSHKNIGFVTKLKNFIMQICKRSNKLKKI